MKLSNGLLLRKSPWGGTEVPLRAEARATTLLVGAW